MKTTIKISPQFVFIKRATLLFSFVASIGMIDVKAQDSEDERVYNLSPFEIQEEATRGYESTYSYGATRINVSMLEVPNSIITVNQQLLSDLSADENIFDALKYVSGVSVASSPGNGQLTLRGYNTGLDGFRDGLSDPANTFGFINPEGASYERVEIIKGAAGTLYGTHTLGGIFNAVTKRPLSEPFTEFGLEFGSENRVGFVLDTTGPVNEDKSILYRFVAADRSQDKVWGGNGVNDTQMFYGWVDFIITPDSKAWFSFEYKTVQREVQTSHLFTDSEFTIAEFIPRETPIDEIWKGPDDQEKFFYEMGLTSNFEFLGVPWSTRIVARAVKIEFDDEITDKLGYQFIGSDGNPILTSEGEDATDRNMTFDTLFANPLFASGPRRGNGDKSNIVGDILVRRSLRDQAQEVKAGNVNFELFGQFDIGPTSHDLLTYSSFNSSESRTQRIRFNYTPINLINPQYVRDPTSEARTGFNSFLINTDNSNTSFNFGMQDNISIMDRRLIFVAGARYDRERAQRIDMRRDTFSVDKDSAWTFKYGMVYKPFLDKGFSIFIDHTETIDPRSGVDEIGQEALDLAGEHDEIGIKLAALDSKIVLTASYFDMVLDGYQSNDFVFIGEEQFRIFVDAGQNDTQGWEMDLVANPTDSWSIMAGYGDLTSRSRKGRRFRHVAEGPNYNIISKYSFQEGVLEGFEAALGYVYVNRRAADGADNFSLPAFDTMDLMLAYQKDNWRVQANISNLEDDYFPISSINRTRIYIADPRQWKMSIKYFF